MAQGEEEQDPFLLAFVCGCVDEHLRRIFADW